MEWRQTEDDRLGSRRFSRDVPPPIAEAGFRSRLPPLLCPDATRPDARLVPPQSRALPRAVRDDPGRFLARPPHPAASPFRLLRRAPPRLQREYAREKGQRT